MLIGLAGKKRVGKDTIAEQLTTHRGFVRLAFADALKAVLLDVDPLVELDSGALMRLRVAVALYGWEGAKAHAEVRRLMQRHGVAIREHVGGYVWIDVIATKAEVLLGDGHDVVITDVRFPNEVDAVRKRLGGVIVEVTREAAPNDDGHVSEQLVVDGPHLTLANDGDLVDLVDDIDDIVAAARALTSDPEFAA